MFSDKLRETQRGFHYELVDSIGIEVSRIFSDSGPELIYLTEDCLPVDSVTFLRIVDAHQKQIQDGISWKEPIREDYLKYFGLSTKVQEIDNE